MFEGDVVETWTEWADNVVAMPRTCGLIDVHTLYEGLIASGGVVLCVPGGPLVDGTGTVYVVGAPDLVLGDRVLVHARPLGDDRVTLLNGSIDLLRIVEGDGAEPRVIAPSGDALRALELDDVPQFVADEVHDAVDGECPDGAAEVTAPVLGDWAVLDPFTALTPDEVRVVVSDALALTEATGEPAAYIAGLAAP